VAVKIVRQHDRIALLGAPVSAAALAPGGEGAPSVLRNAGLVSKLQSIGYQVADAGDDPQQLFQPDSDSPRARNLQRVLAALEALRPRVEIAVKSGALPLILGGDCSIALAVVAGMRRYYRHVSMLYADADADLQTPATTTSGCVDGMVVSHLVGRGASELVRFWSEPPLVREPDLALFGVSRLDPAEERALQTSPLRRYLADDIRRKSPAKAATEAVERIHGASHEFVLHFDVDVIADFQATNVPSSGLRLDEIREAFAVFVAEPRLAAIEITGYNPSKDTEATGANLIVEFLAEMLAIRREKMKAVAAPEASKSVVATHAGEASAAAAELSPSAAILPPPAAPGEAWSSDMLEDVASDGDAENKSEADSSADSGPNSEAHEESASSAAAEPDEHQA
jgi:arginase